MNRPDTTFLQEQIQTVSAWHAEFQWMIDVGLQAEKAVQFGCDPAGKSLALMWALGANKVLNIDPDEVAAYREETTLTRIRQDMADYWNYLSQSPGLSDEDIDWWNSEVPEFFKHEMTKDEFFIDCLARDFTKFTGIPAGFFDVAFCDFVLHQIWWDKTRKNPEKAAAFVISEMARLVRPGGFVAAFEWVRFRTFAPLDFRRLFEQTGLLVVHIKEARVDNWRGRGDAISIVGQMK